MRPSRFKIGLAIALFVSSISTCVIAQRLYAVETNPAVTAVFDTDMGAKAIIKADKDKIAREREAILEDGRRLQEAKKTGDKAKIEEVKKEVNEDIAKRKAAIKAIYDDMENRAGDKSFEAPKSRGRRLK